jgi:hypothetical protein
VGVFVLPAVGALAALANVFSFAAKFTNPGETLKKLKNLTPFEGTKGALGISSNVLGMVAGGLVIAAILAPPVAPALILASLACGAASNIAATVGNVMDLVKSIMGKINDIKDIKLSKDGEQLRAALANKEGKYRNLEIAENSLKVATSTSASISMSIAAIGIALLPVYAPAGAAVLGVSLLGGVVSGACLGLSLISKAIRNHREKKDKLVLTEKALSDNQSKISTDLSNSSPQQQVTAEYKQKLEQNKQETRNDATVTPSTIKERHKSEPPSLRKEKNPKQTLNEHRKTLTAEYELTRKKPTNNNSTSEHSNKHTNKLK